MGNGRIIIASLRCGERAAKNDMSGRLYEYGIDRLIAAWKRRRWKGGGCREMIGCKRREGRHEIESMACWINGWREEVAGGMDQRDKLERKINAPGSQ